MDWDCVTDKIQIPNLSSLYFNGELNLAAPYVKHFNHSLKGRLVGCLFRVDVAVGLELACEAEGMLFAAQMVIMHC